MPTVANTSGWPAARARQAMLDGAVVATVITCARPPARARPSTAGRSPANCPSSRCAWVSTSEATSGGARGLGRAGRQPFQGGEVALFHVKQPVNLRPGVAILDGGPVTLQV